MEKEAWLGALRAIGGGIAKLVGRGAAAAGRGISTAAKGVASLPGEAVHGIRNIRISRGLDAVKKTETALMKARGAQASLQAAGKGSTYRSGVADSYAKQLESKREKVKGLIAKQHEARGVTKGAPPPIPDAAKRPKATAPVAEAKPPATPSAPKPSAPKAGDPIAASKASEAAKPKTTAPETPPPSTAGAAGKADDLTMNVTKGEGATLKSSWTKLRDGGWKSLDGAEKQKLINAGLATVVGGRVILGKGILTGGEGII
jgi:hypothetical protein